MKCQQAEEGNVVEVMHHLVLVCQCFESCMASVASASIHQVPSDIGLYHCQQVETGKLEELMRDHMTSGKTYQLLDTELNYQIGSDPRFLSAALN